MNTPRTPHPEPIPSAAGTPTGYLLERTQVVAGRLPEVFAFFKDPYNLERITPPWLRFSVLWASDSSVQVGTRIGYRLRWQGLPLGWETVIAEYRENVMFADEMARGPYRRWYHRHWFRSVPGGVEMTDRVEYALPLGGLGQLAHRVAIRRQLDAIFDYRARAVAEIFRPSRRPAELRWAPGVASS